VDQLRARVLSAEAQVRRLEALSSQAATTRGNAIVRAPIAGIVGRRHLSQGDMAAPTMPVLTLVQMGDVELILDVPERELALISEGMAAELRVARFAERRFPGRVALISPTIDRQTRTARVKVEAPNPEGHLLPGMLARVELIVERRADVPVVPYSGLIIESNQGGEVAYRAFVVDDGAARERRPSLGLIDGDQVEVLDGLKVGELLVTRGQHLLEEGTRVKTVSRIDLAGRPIAAPAAPAARRAPASQTARAGAARP
jgi:RND family efflux transporter MFP subunit